MSKIKVTNNSKLVLGFTLLCAITLIINYATGGVSNRLLFSVYRAPLTNPLTYIRFFGHVLGHANFEHFIGNIMLIVVVGPMLEEKYGAKDLLTIMLISAFVTGLIHFIFFPGIQLLGASGIVFTFILLASFTGYKGGNIPLTFIVVAVLYIGNDVYQGLFVNDNVANLMHIIGGLVGAFFGFILNKNK